MNTIKILISSFIFKSFTDDDRVYHNFIDSYKKNEINFKSKKDIKNLINWLRKWGCRNFEISYTPHAIRNIITWYKTNNKDINKLPKTIKKLDEAKHKELINDLYTKLSNQNASKRKRIGDTAASKILFVLNNKLFAPCDKNERKALKIKNKDYFNYINRIKTDINNLNDDCKKKKISYNDFRMNLGRKHKSDPKLIEEYYFVNNTFKININNLIKLIFKK